MSEQVAQVGSPFRETPELRASYRRLCLAMAALAGGMLAVLAAANIVVDPFGAFGFVKLRAFEGRREAIGTRTGKAELLRHHPHHTVLLGSSRAEVGFDPALPAWGVSESGAGTVNLGLGGTNMAELFGVYRFAARQPGVRRVVLFLDFLMFTEGRTYSHDFTRSRLNPLTERPNYHMSNLFSRFATEQTLGTLGLAASGRKSKYTELGFRAGHDPLGAEGSHRTLFRNTIRNALTNPEVYGRFVYSPRRVEMVGEILRDAHARGIEVVVVVPPIHALELETVRAAGLWETFEAWKRDLVKQADASRYRQPLGSRASGDAEPHAVQVWDFADYTEYAMEPVPPEGSRARMRWFWEASHFTRELGERVVSRMADASAAHPDGARPLAGPFGVKLTSETIEAHLREVAARHDRYAATRPEDTKLIDEARAGRPAR